MRAIEPYNTYRYNHNKCIPRWYVTHYYMKIGMYVLMTAEIIYISTVRYWLYGIITLSMYRDRAKGDFILVYGYNTI